MAQSCVVMRPRQEHLFTPGKPPLQPQLDNTLITSTVRKRKVDPGETPQPPQQQQAAAAPEDGKRQRTPPLDRGLAHGDGVVHLILSPAAPKAAAGAGAQQQQREERQQQPGPSQHQREQQQHQAAAAAHQQQQHGKHAADDEQQEGVLFSPLFHLHREESGSWEDLSACTASAAAAHCQVSNAVAGGGGGAALSAVPQQQGGAAGKHEAAADRSSTDLSTGTSASLDSVGADVSAGADAAAAAATAAAQQQARLAVSSPVPAAPQAAVAMTTAAAAAEYESEVGAGDEEDQEERAVAAAAAEAAEEGEEYLEFDPLLFIKRLPPLERCVPPRRDFLLPKKTRRSKLKTLVLDLDETLVHSTLDGYCRPDFTFPVEVGAMRHMVSVRQRPHLHTFLERVAQLYEVVVFTASQRVYAEQLLNIVDPERRLVRHRVYRESCVFWEGNYLKDLTVLGRDLAHTIIVDNSPQAFGFQIDNGIPIESWYDDDADDELLKLIPFLEKMAHSEDVRPHIQKRYRLRSLVDSAADPEHYLIQQQLLLQQQQQRP